MIYFLFFNALRGLLGGLAWSWALGKSLQSGIYLGGAIGAFLGVFFYLFSKAASSRGAVTKGESAFVSNSFANMILSLAVIIALIAWIVRLIFF